MLWGDVSLSQMEEQLNIVQSSGASVLRVDVGWSSLQQTDGSEYEGWYLAKLDKLVEGADARGIKLLLTLEGTPCWASSAPESIKQGCRGEWWSRGVQNYPPNNPESYASALAFLVKRYEQKVYAWEIWNEPNLSEFWNTSEPAVEYVKLVKAAYPAAKAADPETTVVAGAISQSDYEFTAQLFQLGIKGYFDAFSIHAYSEDASPAAARSNPRYSFVDGVPKIHETMLAYGDTAPLWITETGYSTSTTRSGPAWVDGVSEAEQAQYIAEQAAMVKSWPYVAVTVWYELENESEEASNLNANYGLLHCNGAPKPAWGSFLAAVQLLQDTSTEGGGALGKEEASSGTPVSSQPTEAPEQETSPPEVPQDESGAGFGAGETSFGGANGNGTPGASGSSGTSTGSSSGTATSGSAGEPGSNTTGSGSGGSSGSGAGTAHASHASSSGAPHRGRHRPAPSSTATGHTVKAGYKAKSTNRRSGRGVRMRPVRRTRRRGAASR
jgi:hypothetical protein